MKRVYGLFLLIAAVAVAIPAIERMMSRHSGRSARSEGHAAPESTKASTPPLRGTLYRWRDAGGTLHIESSPPADRSRYEAIPYLSRRPAGPEQGADSIAGGNSRQSTPPTAKQQHLDESPLSVYSPGGLNELLDRVQTTAGQLDERRQTFRDLKDDL